MDYGYDICDNVDAFLYVIIFLVINPNDYCEWPFASAFHLHKLFLYS